MSTKREGIPEYEKADLDEPLFVLRAQDVIAPIIVELYAVHLAGRRGQGGQVNQAKVESVRKAARAMRVWQESHPTKVPD
jgi:hypothetical protein